MQLIQSFWNNHLISDSLLKTLCTVSGETVSWKVHPYLHSCWADDIKSSHDTEDKLPYFVEAIFADAP